MPRTCSADLLTTIQSQVPTLAVLVKLTRIDGTIMGFTSTNRNLTIEGILYERSSAISPSNLRSTVGAGVDNMDLMGLLNSNRITDVDVLAGLYDGATVELFLCNYKDISQGTIALPQGTLGEVTIEDCAYVVEFRSLTQRLQQDILDVTQPGCRAPSFGDPNTCASGGLIGGHALSFYERTAQVLTVAISQSRFHIASSEVTGFYDYGRCKCTSGLNINIEREIKESLINAGVADIILRQSFPFLLQVGDEFTLTRGCDFRFSTCVNVFDNAVNFRGEPHVPGVDKIIQRGRR
jgi:uncharacterized phage protein (TIGR02218 family)